MAIPRIVLLAGLALPLGYHRYLGLRATRRVSIEVACLSLDRIVDIGTRSSASMVKRAAGQPQPYAAEDGAVEWRARSKGGVMLYRVLPLPHGLGFRVESWATAVTITRMQGSQDLLRRRQRTLQAISRAASPFPRPRSPYRKQHKEPAQGTSARKHRTEPAQETAACLSCNQPRTAYDDGRPR